MYIYFKTRNIDNTIEEFNMIRKKIASVVSCLIYRSRVSGLFEYSYGNFTFVLFHDVPVLSTCVHIIRDM